MGKVRRVKQRAHISTNPLLSYGGLEFSELLHNTSEGPIKAICDHLQNADADEKLNGLHSLAVLAQRNDQVPQICKSDIVRIAGPLLCDINPAIQNAAAGAFRNLSVFGSEVCDYLVDNDILTSLLTLIMKYNTEGNWLPILNPNSTRLDLKSDVFLQAINLLRNLCESSPSAVDAFNQINLLNGLLRCLDYTKFGLEISISVAQLFLVISENNLKTWNILVEEPLLKQLLNVDDSNYSLLYLGTLAAGILCNVPAFSSAYAKDILQNLDKVISVDIQFQLVQIKSAIEDVGKTGEPQLLEVSMEINDEETENIPTQGKSNAELQTDSADIVNIAAHLIDAQRLVAEIISNFCSSDEQSSCSSEFSDLSDNESITDFDMEDQTANEVEGGLPVHFVETIKSKNIVQKLWQRSQPTDEIVNALIEQNVELKTKIMNMRISCLICLQNLCNVLTIDEFGGYESAYDMWVNLGLLAFKGTNNPLLMEAITSLMRSLLNHLKLRADLFKQMTSVDLNMILDATSNCTVMEIRVNLCRMLGSLGSLLSESLVKAIVIYLLDACNKEEDLWALSEELDAIMDAFAVNDWDQIIVELNMPSRIQKLSKTFQSKLRQQRKELKERYAAMQTVKINLCRFVKYIDEKSQNFSKNVK